MTVRNATPWCWVTSVALGTWLAGCGGRTPTPVAPSTSASSVAHGAPAAHTEIRIRSRPDTNRGAVLHMMVRTIEGKAPTESYDDEAARLSSALPDASIVTTRALLPGRELVVPFDAPATRTLAAIFFFTQPGANWRVVLPSPLPARLNIVLGSDTVESVGAS